jgi:hypothetical protein
MHEIRSFFANFDFPEHASGVDDFASEAHPCGMDEFFIAHLQAIYIMGA